MLFFLSTKSPIKSIFSNFIPDYTISKTFSKQWVSNIKSITKTFHPSFFSKRLSSSSHNEETLSICKYQRILDNSQII